MLAGELVDWRRGIECVYELALGSVGRLAADGTKLTAEQPEEIADACGWRSAGRAEGSAPRRRDNQGLSNYSRQPMVVS